MNVLDKLAVCVPQAAMTVPVPLDVLREAIDALRDGVKLTYTNDCKNWADVLKRIKACDGTAADSVVLPFEQCRMLAELLKHLGIYL